MRSLSRICTITMMFIRPSGTGVYCYRNGVLWHRFKFMLTPIFLQFHLEERWGMDVQTRPRVIKSDNDK